MKLLKKGNVLVGFVCVCDGVWQCDGVCVYDGVWQ